MLKSKVAHFDQKVATEVFTSTPLMVFKIAQQVIKHFGYF